MNCIGGRGIGSMVANLLFECGGCRLPVAAQAIDHGQRANNIAGLNLNLSDEKHVQIAVWPQLTMSSAPKHVPPRVAAVYISALNSTRKASDADEGARHVAGLALGKALEMGLRAYDPTVKGMLAARITALAKQGKLPGDLADWCQQLRAIRNEATHEDDALSMEDLDNFAKAIETIFMHLFTMPGMLLELQGKQVP